MHVNRGWGNSHTALLGYSLHSVTSLVKLEVNLGIWKTLCSAPCSADHWGYIT